MSAEPPIGASRAGESARAAKLIGRFEARRRFALWSAAMLLAHFGLAWFASRSWLGPQAAATPEPVPIVPIGVATAKAADFFITLAALGTVTLLATGLVVGQILTLYMTPAIFLRLHRSSFEPRRIGTACPIALSERTR